METNDLNLCEILEGHQGEMFYSPIFGNVIFFEIEDSRRLYPIKIFSKSGPVLFTKYGKYSTNPGAECLLFPSKEQRDWNKWIEEKNSKAPNTWSEYIDSDKYTIVDIPNIISNKESIIGKSLFAHLKIHKLIEVRYGGNVTQEEWEDANIKKYYAVILFKRPVIAETSDPLYRHIAFHSKEQAEEFISYLENMQLVLDYYMIYS